MTNWIGIEEASKLYKVADKRIYQWCQQGEIIFSEVRGDTMIEENSLKQRLELNKRECISKVELENRTKEILQNNRDRIFILESLVKLTPIMKVVLQELGEMIIKDECRELFLYLATGGNIENYAKENGLTVIKVQKILDTAILEIERNKKFLREYPKKRELLKRTSKKQNKLKKEQKEYVRPQCITVEGVPEKEALLLATSIDDLGFDIRTLHCLANNQLDTLGDILYYTKLNGFDKLLELNRFGTGCLTKLKSHLVKMDIINEDGDSCLYDYIIQG